MIRWSAFVFLCQTEPVFSPCFQDIGQSFHRTFKLQMVPDPARKFPSKKAPKNHRTKITLSKKLEPNLLQ